MTRKSETNDREGLDRSGEIRPGFREFVGHKNYPIRSRRLPLRWGCLLFSGLLSFAPALPSHRVLAALERGAFKTQAQVGPHTEAFALTQALVAAQEGPTFSLGVDSSQVTDLVESGQEEDAPTGGGNDAHGSTDDDGDDGEDDDGDDDDDARLPPDAPLLEHAKTDILRLSPEYILVL